MTPTAIQVPEEIEVQSIATVTGQLDIQILDDLDLDNNAIANVGRAQLKGLDSDTVDTFQSASISNTDIKVRARINLDGNDLYNVDDFELDGMVSNDGQEIACTSGLQMGGAGDILRANEIQAETFTDLP